MTVIAIHTPYDKVVEDLSERFLDATTTKVPASDRNGFKRLRPNNHRGTQLYKLQTEFAYMINEITSGPSYIAPKIIDNCNKFIDGIIKQREDASQA